MAAKGPLRKIVGYKWIERELAPGIVRKVFREVLECGHLQQPVTDYTGEATSYPRRRCRQCGRIG